MPQLVPDLLTLREAQALVLGRARPLSGETVPVWEAAGRVTSEPARAVVALPPFPSSAMDGFALRAADLPGTLPIVERIAAGRPATRALRPGEAMAISTGGVVPEGADSVVPIEYVVQHDNEIDVAEPVPPGAHVRPRGGDVAEGDVVVDGAVRIGPVQLGALAAAAGQLGHAGEPRPAEQEEAAQAARRLVLTQKKTAADRPCGVPSPSQRSSL